MSFVIDGSEWHFDGLSNAQLETTFQTLIDRVRRVTERGERIWYGDNFQSRRMLGDRSLWHLFDRGEEIHLSIELQQELAAQLNRLNCYEDEPNWPQQFENFALISIDGAAPSENLDVLWAHLATLGGRATGCIGNARAGKIGTQSEHGETPLHWLGDAEHHTQFWRDAIVVEGDNAETLRRLAPHAYPSLFFPEQVWQGCNDFIGGYYSQSAELRRYLAAFNDYGNWVFTASPDQGLVAGNIVGSEVGAVDGLAPGLPSDQIIIRRFTHLTLDVTPEKANVYKKERTRSAREVTVGTKTLYCEWHGKLQAYQNRIHIHAPIPESGNKLVIAIFTAHLPLPDD